MEGSLVAYKVFTNGSVLNASEMNEYLMNQSVITFSNSTARSSAITSPVEGMITYLEDTNSYEYWDGAAYEPLVGGESYDWVSWTPTLTNLTLGNGTITARYVVIGKTMHFWVEFVLGSTSSVGSSPTISFPSGITSAVSGLPLLGTGTTGNIGGTRWKLVTIQISSSTFRPRVEQVNGTYTNIQDVSATIPATWVTGSTFSLEGTLEIN
jgi:hypothetical protein